MSFNYLGQFDQTFSAGSLFRSARNSHGSPRGPNNLRQHQIEIAGYIIDGRLNLDWTYSENLHRRETISWIAESYLQALRDLISHCQSPQAGGYTPSDFGEVQLTQTELDALLAEFADE